MRRNDRMSLSVRLRSSYNDLKLRSSSSSVTNMTSAPSNVAPINFSKQEWRLRGAKSTSSFKRISYMTSRQKGAIDLLYCNITNFPRTTLSYAPSPSTSSITKRIFSHLSTYNCNFLLDRGQLTPQIVTVVVFCTQLPS